MFDVCIIGHTTKDIISCQGNEFEIPGGVAYYSSIALANLGLNVALITKIAKNDINILTDFTKYNISVYYKESQTTTVFENYYPKGINSRKQKVRSLSKPFCIKDIPDISAKIFHLGPLTQNDIPLNIIPFLSKTAKISLDIQGLLRKVENDQIKLNNWDKDRMLFSNVYILKADEKEAKALTGEKKIKEAAKRISEYGIKEVIITLGSKGSLIFSKGQFFSIPSIIPRKFVDVTGCGDTYMAGYLYKRIMCSCIKESGMFSAAIASLKIENIGAFSGNEKDVSKRLAIAAQAELL